MRGYQHRLLEKQLSLRNPGKPREFFPSLSNCFTARCFHGIVSIEAIFLLGFSLAVLITDVPQAVGKHLYLFLGPNLLGQRLSNFPVWETFPSTH